MRRQIVKLFHGKKPVSVWRITFVRRGCLRFYDGSNYDQLFLTYFCFGTCLPDALNRLYKFVCKSDWDLYKFERFSELDYNIVYEL